MVELDILRAFAVIGVILIHTVSGGLYSFAQSSIAFNVSIVIDQLSRFCVPLFVALSGYTLCLRYKDQKINIKEFFNRRLVRILPWYFFWSAVIFVYIRFTAPIMNPTFPLWKIILLGKADYHLYFVPMIFQLYLLFPLLLPLIRRHKIKLLALIFILQILFYYFLTLISLKQLSFNFLTSDQQQYLFFGTWIFYFVLGIVFALGFKVEEILRKTLLVLFIFSTVWMIYNCFSIISGHYNLIVATRSTRIPVLFYASSFISIAIIYAGKLLIIPKRLILLLGEIGKRSYVIYLLHTLVLRTFSNYIHYTNYFNLIAVFIMTVIVSNYLAQISISGANYLNLRIPFFQPKVKV